ncbi:MAG: acyltransferase family protein, partial [Enterovibrio sp.]
SYFADFGDYFAPSSYEQPLLHTWSLAVEIQFYLLAPFLVLLLPTRWLKWAFAGSLVGLTAFSEYRLRFMGVEQATYYSLYARLPEFFAGGLAALCSMNAVQRLTNFQWSSHFGLLLIVVAMIAQPQLGHFPGIAALLPVSGALLLLAKPAKQSVQDWAGRLLSCKILVWIGGLSYSLYLWHWPVLALLRYYTGGEELDFNFTLLFITITLLLSMLSFYGVEHAFRHSHTSKKQSIVWLILAIGVFGSSRILAKANALIQEPLSIEHLRYADPATICHGQVVGKCLNGNLNSVKEILVLGDSHAAMLNHFFDNLGKKLGFKAQIITASSCVTIPGFDYQRLPEWAQKPCQNQIAAAMPYLASSEVVFVAGSWHYQTQSSAFMAAFDVFLQETAVQNKKIVVLSQVPLLTKNPLRIQRFNQLGLVSHVEFDPEYKKANKAIEAATKKYLHAKYLALDELPVFANTPFYNGQLFYYDEHHLNEISIIDYATQALPIVEKIIIGME